MELKWKYLDELYREKYFDKDVPPVYLKSEADKVIAELKAQKAQAEDDCAFWKTRAQKTADDNLVMAKQLAEKDAEIRKLNFQMWSARCEAAEAECDEPRLARCRYMADKFKEVTK